MMLLATAKQMREADRRTIEELGLPGIVLMENAAQGAARVILEQVGNVLGLDLAAFCGRGNNGGDGLAILRILANQGAEATAYLLCGQEDLKGDAATNLAVAKACGVQIVEIKDEKTWTERQTDLVGHDFYIDALLGTGLNSAVRGHYAQAIDLLNSLEQPVLAVDIPSGLCADTGRPLGAAVVADWTVTFGLVKLGLALEPGDYVGELSCVDISIPPSVVEDLGLNCRLLEADLVEAMLWPRLAGSHKGTYGHLMVVGGSPGKTGAPCLAAWGGIRSGAGLVTVGLPRDLNLAAETILTAAMSQPLPQNSEGCLTEEALPALLDLLAARQTLVLGPGLSTQDDSAGLARRLMAEAKLPLVVDADALNALAGYLGEIRFASPDVVLTPHPGEAARLLEGSVEEIQRDRPAAARRLAEQSGAVVVLKGARTLVAEPRGGLWVNPTGNPLLASGGSGDVLSGLIGGLMAQGLGPEEAACVGVFVHGLAADLAAKDFGLRGLAAEELYDYLPAAFAALECGEPEQTDDEE
jgi:NAD(P)H-hydrate epimerase